jgi:hypothetical protein
MTMLRSASVGEEFESRGGFATGEIHEREEFGAAMLMGGLEAEDAVLEGG